jgi:hypothetical protein
VLKKAKKKQKKNKRITSLTKPLIIEPLG